MAELVIAAAGAAIGGAIAPGVVAFGLTGAAIGWQAGAILGSFLRKGPSVQGPRLGDLRVTGTDYGQPIPWVAGSPRIAGQIIWASSKREIANTQKVGKGGSQKVTSFTYEVDIAILLAENPIKGILRIWSNGEVVYSKTETTTTIKSGVWNGITIYNGDQDQLPDPLYEAAVGVGNAPAYRGRPYVVIQGLQLGNSGQIPNLTFEVATEGVTSTDDDFQDYSPLRLPISKPVGSAFIGCTDTVAKFGESGRFANAFGAGLYVGSSPLDGTLNYPNATFECWLYYDLDEYEGRTIFYNGDLSGITPFQSIASNFNLGTMRIVSRGTNSSGGSINNWSGILAGEPGVSRVQYPKKQWFHFAVVKQGDSWSMYMDGEEVCTWLSTGNIGNINVASIGSTASGYAAWPGYIDDVVISSKARYTAPFDPPGQHVPDEYTRLWIPFQTEEGFSRGAAKLHRVMNDLLLRAGYSSTDFDLTKIVALNKEVRGMAISQVTSTRAVLEQLQSVFFFETAKSDKIYFFPRAANSVAAIPFASLGTNTQPTDGESALELLTANELEIPAQIALTYPNVAGDYNAATEYSQRIDPSQDSTQTIQVPIGLVPEEAKRIVDALLFDQIASATKTTARLPLQYAALEPGDVVTVTNSDGRQYRMRIGRKTDELVVLTFEMTLDDVGALDSAAITDGDYVLNDAVRQLATTRWEAMDIPLLTDRDNEPGFYVAVAPNPSATPFDWPGAAFARSFAADNFVNELITSDRCVVGVCETTLGDWIGPHVFDESHAVEVLVSGELSSTTRAAMLRDLSINICLIGEEVVRFRLAEFLGTVSGANRYRLTGLLRGQRGTERNQTGHVADERFVLLDGNLRSVIDQNGQIGAETEVKAVTLNLLLSSVAEEAFTSNSVRLKPFSVANLRAIADGGDLAVSWQRRTRLSYRYGGPLGDSVPLGESVELYRIRVYDGSTLVRTASASSPSYTYLAADAAADGFSPGEVATIVVTQLSEVLGDGFPSSVQGIIP